jgi:alcohol dehydrogenase class IV
MALAFVYEALPARVVFAPGSLEKLPEEAARLGRRPLVLATRGHRGLAEDAARRLGGAVFAEAVMHVPIAVAEAARAEARRRDSDLLVAIGGGSTVGLAKAVALETGLPILAVPTTYAGSEMTPIWGLTEAGSKRTGRDPKVLPRTVLYDPMLTLSLPPALSGTSGMNAIAHGVEALYARDANPVTSLMAEEGIRALARSLPKIVQAPGDIAARTEALYGAWLCGACLGTVGMALHHKLCHTLGGALGLPHAETHTAVLPHAVAYNRGAAPEAMARIARALGDVDAAEALYELAGALGAKRALADLGMREADLDRIAGLAATNPYWNPRPVTEAGIRALLADAFHGRHPCAT